MIYIDGVDVGNDNFKSIVLNENIWILAELPQEFFFIDSKF